MEYHKYTEIENISPAWIQAVRDHGYDVECTEWCCFDKIDGCNLQIFVDEQGQVHYGSRNKELDRYDAFNNYRSVVAQYKLDEKAIAAKEYWCKDMNRGLKDMILVGVNVHPVVFQLFGEFCGGVYRHPDVAPVKGAQKIQGRVNYSPDNRWVVFDIRVTICTPEPVSYYLPPDDVAFICAKVGLYSQLLVFRGTFDEAIAYPNDFEDEVGHLMFGLPKLEHNITEGVIIRPARELRFMNKERVIVKNKNHIFLERGVKTNKVKNPPTPMSALDLEWFNTYMTYVTESRMMSVLSKLDTTTITQRDFGVLLKAFLDDADKDFNKDFGGQINVLEGSKSLEEFNFMKVLKAARQEAAGMLRPMFLEYLAQSKGV